MESAPQQSRHIQPNIPVGRWLTLLLVLKKIHFVVRGFRTPLKAKKLHYLAASGKWQKTDRDDISNFYKDYFQVRPIMRSPEVSKGQILRK